ncbi:hypothetical protein ABT324_24215 [Saccharopolyspora sp. NPDC000359]|uniref:hypothetical protein n=1 Tax=Saccharopolyspora sp. NPDC000359 TaxID=3154251 RepID=UPI00332BE570
MHDNTAPCTIDRCSHAADHGRYCCSQCAEQLRHWLREIEDYDAATTATPGRGGDGGRRSPGYGSRPPARLDVIAARDPRSVPHQLGPDDTDGDVRSILGTLHSLASWIAEEADDLRPTHIPTIATETRYLRGRIDWCTSQQWIDELADDLHQLHTQARRLAGESPKPLAPCPDCCGPLWPVGNTNVLAVRCSDCGSSYDGLGLLLLGQQAAFERAGAA